MKKECGFTLIELILTLVLTAILAGIVVEIIAGPIRSYFWITQQALRVENAELAMANITRDLQMALPSTVQIENKIESQSVVFRKILFEGLIVPDEKNNAKLLSILGKFGQTLDMSKSYTLFFPLEPNENKFYIVHAKDNTTNGELIFSDDMIARQEKPRPFYLLSNPIQVECKKNTHAMERIEEQNSALVNDSILGCQFSLFQENTYKGVLVSMVIGSKAAKGVRFTQPILFEKS